MGRYVVGQTVHMDLTGMVLSSQYSNHLQTWVYTIEVGSRGRESMIQHVPQNYLIGEQKEPVEESDDI